MPAGRPKIYSQELSDKMCGLLADGLSLRKVCEADDMPCKATVFMWLRTNKEFLDQYTQAKQEAADSYADDINDIADNLGSPILDDDGNPLIDDNGNVATQIDMVSVNHAKLKIDTRKWAASKLKPKKYGDKLDHTHGGGDKPIEHKWTVEVVDADLANT